MFSWIHVHSYSECKRNTDTVLPCWFCELFSWFHVQSDYFIITGSLCAYYWWTARNTGNAQCAVDVYGIQVYKLWPILTNANGVLNHWSRYLVSYRRKCKEWSFCRGGGLAQCLERWTGDHKIEGSNPVRSTKKPCFSTSERLCWLAARVPNPHVYMETQK